MQSVKLYSTSTFRGGNYLHVNTNEKMKKEYMWHNSNFVF